MITSSNARPFYVLLFACIKVDSFAILLDRGRLASRDGTGTVTIGMHALTSGRYQSFSKSVHRTSDPLLLPVLFTF